MGDQPLTKDFIKTLEAPNKGNRITYDADAPGFGIRITAAGARSFVLNYRTKSGRERRYTIGGFPDWTCEAARKEARRLRQLVDQGCDPLGDIEDARAAPTMAELADRFEAEHLPRRRPGTAADYKRMLNNHIRPHFGAHAKAQDVQVEDVEKLHRRITNAGHLYRANRVVAVLSKMTIRWNMTDSNPCKGIERNYESKRRRYLSADELARLTAALAEADKQNADIIRLLLLTGARRGEVLAMRWADIDLEAGVWTKPASTTKQKSDHVVPLSAPARQLLSEIRAHEAGRQPRKPLGEYVFSGAGDTGHIVNLKRAWRHICKAAEINGLRIHDLRHSFASQLASGGASLPLIGALLGHSNPGTTARYSHLFDDPQRQAVERVGAVIAAAENGVTAESPVVPFKPERRT